jgi:hypothetical protein
VRYESSIDLMFPMTGHPPQHRLFRESKLSDKVVVSLALTDPARERRLFRL